MKTHWSRIGYVTACGRHLSSSQHVTRGAADVTCKTCLHVIATRPRIRHYANAHDSGVK